MRTRYKPWIKEALKNFYGNSLVEKPVELKGRWHEFFGNKNPIHIELGMGKGKFIMTLANQNPNVNYIGFEVQEGVIYYPAKTISEDGCKNIALINGDVKDLAEIFGAGEVSQIYINFCDPWPKKRHAKRRLTYKNFLEIYHHILKPEGRIKFKTDNRDLFTFSLEEFEEYGCKIFVSTSDLHHNEEQFEIITALTEYEEKFMKLGIPICYCEAGFSSNS